MSSLISIVLLFLSVGDKVSNKQNLTDMVFRDVMFLGRSSHRATSHNVRKPQNWDIQLSKTHSFPGSC